MQENPLTPEDALAFLVLGEFDRDYSFQRFLEDRRKVISNLNKGLEIDSATWCEFLSRKIMLSIWRGEESREEETNPGLEP